MRSTSETTERYDTNIPHRSVTSSSIPYENSPSHWTRSAQQAYSDHCILTSFVCNVGRGSPRTSEDQSSPSVSVRSLKCRCGSIDGCWCDIGTAVDEEHRLGEAILDLGGNTRCRRARNSVRLMLSTESCPGTTDQFVERSLAYLAARLPQICLSDVRPAVGRDRLAPGLRTSRARELQRSCLCLSSAGSGICMPHESECWLHNQLGSGAIESSRSTLTA
jgi:hypothetical protein